MLAGLSTPWPEPMGEPAGMTDAAPAALMRAADGVVAGVGEHGEAVGDEFACGLKHAEGVGEQGFLVAEDFELDPGGAGVAELLEDVAAEPGDADGVLGVEAPGGVGENGVAGEVERGTRGETCPARCTASHGGRRR